MKRRNVGVLWAASAIAWWGAQGAVAAHAAEKFPDRPVMFTVPFGVVAQMRPAASGRLA